MKFKATRKEMKEGFYKIISVGYCDLQNLLSYENPIAYSTRVEGWACDYYDINGVCICEGYSPIAEQHMKSDYNVIKEFDNKASGKSAEEKRVLLKEFINRCEIG